jgi:hypothetical protein
VGNLAALLGNGVAESISGLFAALDAALNEVILKLHSREEGEKTRKRWSANERAKGGG